jgi:hypothetical protein
MSATSTAWWIRTNRAPYSPFRPAAWPSAGRYSEVHADLLASRPRLTGEIRPAIRNGDIAITSTGRAGNATVEVPRHIPHLHAGHRAIVPLGVPDRMYPGAAGEPMPHPSDCRARNPPGRQFLT